MLLRMAPRMPILSCTSMIGAKRQHDGQQHAGHQHQHHPSAPKVVNRISSSSLGSTGAEAPMARALTR